MNKNNQQFQQNADQSLTENKKACHSREGGNLEMTENDTDKSRDALQCVATDKKIALKVTNVSKVFKISHKKIDSMKGAFVNVFSKKAYKEFYALKDVSLEVKKGEFFGIIGHNGAGKSTLLKILAGVYQPSSGTVNVSGMISPFLELGIGFNPELSGRDNVYLNATVLGLTKAQIDEKFDDIVKFAELENFIDEQLKNYSSGMKSRLAFSVSISANRDILLMDEVLAVGDSRFKEKCLDIFRGYKAQGKTVILVTHSIATVREYCDRAMLLHRGQLIEAGDVDTVCDEYNIKNMTVAGTIELGKLKKSEEIDKRDIAQKNNTVDVSIVGISTLNVDGNTLTKITRGDDFIVKVHVDVKKVAKNLVLAVQIFDKKNDVFVCGNNTFSDKFDCDWKVGKNIFEVQFKNTMFNAGEIYIRAIMVLHGEEGNHTSVAAFCNKEQKQEFIKIIKQDNSGGGIMRIEHNWNKIN